MLGFRLRGGAAAAGLQSVAIWKWMLLPWMTAVILMAYLWAEDLPSFQSQGTARIIFWHVPMAMLSVVWFIRSAYHGLRYLASGSQSDDTRAALAAEMGLLLTILTTVTGSIFSKMQWAGGFNSPWYFGWWQWDPKQTAIVVVALIFTAYFGLRMTVDDPRLRARLCAVYSVLGCLAVPFLYWVLPHIPALQSNHPTDVVRSGMDTAYRTTWILAMIGFFGITQWGYQLKVRVADVAARREADETATETVRVEAVRRTAAEQ